MDFPHLREFLVVADHLNLSHAAEKLGISQPFLSKKMARLQEHVGLQLYARKGHGIALTDAGVTLWRRGAAIFDAITSTNDLLADLRGGVTGHVRLGAGPSFMTHVVPVALAELHREEPGLRFTVREGTTQELCEWVKTREIDCAMLGWVGTPGGREPLDPALSFSRLITDDLVLVTRRDHPLQQAPLRHFSDVSPYSWIMPRSNLKLHQEIDRLFLENNAPSLTVKIHTTSLFATFAILRRTDMITVLAKSALSEADTGSVRALEQPWFNLRREAFLVTMKGMQLSPSANKLVQMARRHLRPLSQQQFGNQSES